MESTFTLNSRRIGRRPSTTSTSSVPVSTDDNSNTVQTRRNVTNIVWKVINTELFSDVLNPFILSIVIMIVLTLYYFNYIDDGTIIQAILLRELKNCILRLYTLMKPFMAVMKLMYQAKVGRPLNL